MIAIGMVILKAHSYVLLGLGMLLAAAGIAQDGCAPGALALPCLGFGPDLSPALFAFALVFVVPGVVKLVLRLRG